MLYVMYTIRGGRSRISRRTNPVRSMEVTLIIDETPVKNKQIRF